MVRKTARDFQQNCDKNQSGTVRHHLVAYLEEFWWRDRIKDKNSFEELLKYISLLYPPNLPFDIPEKKTTEHDLTEIDFVKKVESSVDVEDPLLPNNPSNNNAAGAENIDDILQNDPNLQEKAEAKVTDEKPAAGSTEHSETEKNYVENDKPEALKNQEHENFSEIKKNANKTNESV
uniref:Uncharacterized protein n=1 Tax=Ditylenchus dipsaci TaxID=166011 RepID=A0A915ECW0_9BILA